MTNDTVHPLDDLQELLDGRLDPARHADVELHLESCAACRDELESLAAARSLLRSSFVVHDVPASLEAAVAAALDRESGAGSAVPPARVGIRWTRAAAWTLAAAALVMLALWVTTRRPDTSHALVRDVIASARAWRATPVAIDHTTRDAADLAAWFDANLPFGVTVYDLGMMGYDLMGGRIEQVDGRQSAAFGYEDASARRVVCHMFLGTMDELPPGAEVRTHEGRTFLVYHDGADTVVFWPEGKVVCAFVGNLPPEDVIRLAYAKASKAPKAS